MIAPAMIEHFETLNGLRDRVTDELLHESGRYFADCTCDLTQCTHGETGNFRNREDGKAVALLWNLWKAGAFDGSATITKGGDHGA